jgi:hypothetical protein
MKVQSVNFYSDGGTAQVITDQGEYYVDGQRKNTWTATGSRLIYDKYPNKKGAKKVNEIKDELIEALEKYNETKRDSGISILIQELDQLI